MAWAAMAAAGTAGDQRRAALRCRKRLGNGSTGTRCSPGFHLRGCSGRRRPVGGAIDSGGAQACGENRGSGGDSRRGSSIPLAGKRQAARRSFTASLRSTGRPGTAGRGDGWELGFRVRAGKRAESWESEGESGAAAGGLIPSRERRRRSWPTTPRRWHRAASEQPPSCFPSTRKTTRRGSGLGRDGLRAPARRRQIRGGRERANGLTAQFCLETIFFLFYFLFSKILCCFGNNMRIQTFMKLFWK
jgi:hypothetical protein